MKKMKKITALSLALLMLLSLCACGRSSKSEMAIAEPAAPMPMPAATVAPMYDMAVAEENGIAYKGSGFSADATMSGAQMEAAQTNVAANIDPEKIIYSASATVETTDFDAAVSGVTALVKSYGGFVESSSVNGTNYYNKSRGYNSSRSANFTIRIPSADFNTVMNSLSELGNVPYSYTYTENISAQYYDTEARLKAYKTQEESLLRMMELAESVEDIIAIEDKLSSIRYNIESLQTTLNRWDRKVSYSTIDLCVQEVQEYTPQTEEKISYGRRLMLSLRSGLKNVGSFFEELLVWLLGALPVLAILAVLAFAVVLPLIKRARAKRKAAKESRKDGQ